MGTHCKSPGKVGYKMGTKLDFVMHRGCGGTRGCEALQTQAWPGVALFPARRKSPCSRMRRGRVRPSPILIKNVPSKVDPLDG